MGKAKKYASTEYYKARLKNMMERLGVKNYDYDYGLKGAWVDFEYKGTRRRLEYTLATAQAAGLKLTQGSDAFAKIVMTLGNFELAFRERVYTLDMFLGGLPALPAASATGTGEIPEWALRLGFSEMPKAAEEVNERARKLAKALHADAGGKDADMAALNKAWDEGLQYFKGLKR